MPLEGLLDIENELKRLKGQLAKIEEDLERVTRKLDNIAFVSKAPVEVVDQQKERKRELLEKQDKLAKLIEVLAEQSK